MIIRALIASVISIYLASCTTVDKVAYERKEREFEARIGTHVGKTIDELVLEFGPPNGTFKTPSGMEIYSYTEGAGTTTQTNVHATGFTGPNIFGAPTHTATTSSRSRWCKVDFYINQEKKVFKFEWEGNYCHRGQQSR